MAAAPSESVACDTAAAPLRRPNWSRRAWEYRLKYGPMCERGCGDHGAVVHHKTYENWGREPDEDLEFLCRSCHGRTHAEWRRAEHPEEDDDYDRLYRAFIAADEDRRTELRLYGIAALTEDDK